jgi:hypothetical protein
MFGNEPMLTADRLRKLLTYNPGTDVFRWKVHRNNKVSEGDIAGHEHYRTKRRTIAVDGHLYQAGRLAWLYMKGTWPNQLISCVNGDPSDILRTTPLLCHHADHSRYFHSRRCDRNIAKEMIAYGR